MLSEKCRVNYEPGDLEFYKKMWAIDPDAAKIWITNRLNTLIEIQENIKNEMKQLREVINYKEDKKVLNYYHALGGDERKSYSNKNREIIIDYMRENLDVAVRTKDIVNKFLSLGIKDINIYPLLTDLVNKGSIVRVSHGYLKLPESRISVEV